MLCGVPVLLVPCQPITAERMLSVLDQREQSIKKSQADLLQVLKDQSRQIDLLDGKIRDLQRQLISLKQKQKKCERFLGNLPARFRLLDRKQYILQIQFDDIHMSMPKVSLVEKEFQVLLKRLLTQSQTLIRSLSATQDQKQKARICWRIRKHILAEKICGQEIDRCRVHKTELASQHTSLLSQRQQLWVSQNNLQKKQRDEQEDLIRTETRKKHVQRFLYSQQTLRLQAIVQKEMAELAWSQLYQEQRQLWQKKQKFYDVFASFT